MASMEEAKICIVVAMSRTRRALGKDGRLLWHIPEDFKRFKTLTVGHPVIMGRKTFDSILTYLGTPLPNRTNIVVTRNRSFTYPSVMCAPSLAEAIENARVLDTKEIHIGGGADIYAQTLPVVDRLYLTLVDDEPEADTFFPDYANDFPTVIERERHTTPLGLTYEWVTLERSPWHKKI